MSDTLAATDHMSLSLWRNALDMLAATGLCLYGGMCTTIQCGMVSYMFRSIVRWLYSSHYSMVGVVRCGNQKAMATLDSILPAAKSTSSG